VAVLAATMLFLWCLPASRRRIEYRPVLCLVIAVTLLCTYHQNYDMLIVSGAIVPVTLVGPRSVAMFPVFGLAGISGALPGKSVAVVADPLCLVAIAILSALVARLGSAPHGAELPDSIDTGSHVRAWRSLTSGQQIGQTTPRGVISCASRPARPGGSSSCSAKTPAAHYRGGFPPLL
jgi:hypothetical protein